ncbi:MAG: RNA-binding S4 domain-containing protein [Bacteroidaceae bacterium]|nr:RNA-binding S4 domain-containing protein [Bacteroidaceae bacterium]
MANEDWKKAFSEEGGQRPRRPRIQRTNTSAPTPMGGSYQHRERPAYGERPQRPSYGERPQRPAYGERPQRPAYGERPQRPAYGERPQRPSYGERPQRPAYGERPQRPAYGERPQRPAYGERPQRPGYGSRPRKPYNPNAKYSFKKQIEYKEAHYDPNEPMRLNKFLANAGVCSRREADEFIAAGVVKVNGEIVTELGTKIKPTDEVRFHEDTVSIEKKVYVLLNKPKGYVTTVEDPQDRKTVMDLVKGACRERIYPVGRLDRNTTGVLLLTNDGELAAKLTHPQYRKKKIYHVHLDRNVTAADMRLIADGIQLDDGEIHADAIEYSDATDKKQVGIEIHSGRNRIVRRIFEHLGYKVLKLDRVYFAGLTKKLVKRGDWRFLTEKEVNMLRMGAFE